MKTPFAQRVGQAMEKRGYTLRSFCRAVELDPSFFSKVLAGKRSPPSEEAVLRRIAVELGLGAPELIVAAGRIPSEWSGLWTDPALFERVHGLAALGAAVSSSSRPEKPAETHARPEKTVVREMPHKKPPLADELL